MEDAATAEISRALAWQWLHHGVVLDDGQKVTKELLRRIIAEETAQWKIRVGEDAYVYSRHVSFVLTDDV